MKVFLTGGTGAIGRPAVDALVSGGHDVSALARTPAKAAELTNRGASPISASLFDIDGLTAAFVGHDSVVNLATALPATHRFTSRRVGLHRPPTRPSGGVVTHVDGSARSLLRSVTSPRPAGRRRRLQPRRLTTETVVNRFVSRIVSRHFVITQVDVRTRPALPAPWSQLTIPAAHGREPRAPFQERKQCN